MSELLSDDELVAIASDWETGNSEECRTIRALLSHIAALTKQSSEWEALWREHSGLLAAERLNVAALTKQVEEARMGQFSKRKALVEHCAKIAERCDLFKGDHLKNSDPRVTIAAEIRENGLSRASDAAKRGPTATE